MGGAPQSGGPTQSGVITPKEFSLNLHQAKSGVISIWVGGVPPPTLPPKKFSFNLHQVKSGIISIWVGEWVGGSVNSHYQDSNIHPSNCTSAQTL